MLTLARTRCFAARVRGSVGAGCETWTAPRGCRQTPGAEAAATSPSPASALGRPRVPGTRRDSSPLWPRPCRCRTPGAAPRCERKPALRRGTAQRRLRRGTCARTTAGRRLAAAPRCSCRLPRRRQTEFEECGRTCKQTMPSTRRNGASDMVGGWRLHWRGQTLTLSTAGRRGAG